MLKITGKVIGMIHLTGMIPLIGMIHLMRIITKWDRIIT